LVAALASTADALAQEQHMYSCMYVPRPDKSYWAPTFSAVSADARSLALNC